MATSFAKRFFFGAVASAFLIALVAAILLSWGRGSDPAQASHDGPGGITFTTPNDEVGFDMLTAGNSGTTLGAINNCVAVSDVNAGTPADFDFDVFYDGINPAAGDGLMSGYGYVVNPKPSHSLAGLVVRALSASTGFGDPLHMLAQNPASGPATTLGTSPVPSALTAFAVSHSDLNAGSQETAVQAPRGVLNRFSVDVSGAAPGLYPMILTHNPFTITDGTGLGALVDFDNDATDFDADGVADPDDTKIDAFFGYGLIAVAPTTCPAGADLKDMLLSADVQGLADLNGDTNGNDIGVSQEYPVALTEVMHNNGPENNVATKLDISCTSPESLAGGSPGGSCSFHVTADLYQPPYIQNQNGNFLEVTVDGVVVATDPPVGSSFFASWPQVLDVHKVVQLPQSVPVQVIEEWDIQCFEPSTHSWTFDKTIAPESQFVPELNNSDNDGADSVQVNCIAATDLKIATQTITSSMGATIIGSDGFDNDGDTFVDEDGPGDCDGDGNAQDDIANGAAVDEDGGMCPVIAIDKTIHNNGPWTPVATNINKVVYAARVLNSLTGAVTPLPPRGGVFPGCDLTALPSDPPQTSLVQSVSQIQDENYVLSCDQRGAFVDDDGDSPDGPGGVCNPPYQGVPQCLNYVDEDPPDGADNDADTLVDEDGPVSLTVIVALNLITPKDPHIVDANLAPPCNPLDPNTWAAGLCGNNGKITTLTITDVLPFNPSFSTTEDEVDAGNQVTPVDNNCLITLPCKINYHYAIPGGNPLANVTLSIPPAYTLTRATELGAKVAKVNAIASVSLSNGPCNPNSFPVAMDLYDGALPGEGMGDDVPSASSALANYASWSTHLNAMVALYAPAVLMVREINYTTVAGTTVPINVLIFNAGPTGYLKVLIIGDPDDDGDGTIDALDADDDGDTIPDYSDLDFDNDTTTNAFETLTPIPGGSFCAPLTVDLLEMGISAGAPLGKGASGPPLNLPATVGGDTLTVCDDINTSPGHTFAAQFQRADIGTVTTVPHNQLCSGNNDVFQILKKDENVGNNVVVSADTNGDTTADPPATYRIDTDGDTAVDEDAVDGIDNDGDSNVDEDPAGDPPLAIGLKQGVEVGVIIGNGIVPSDVTEELSIVSQAPCKAEWNGSLSGGTQVAGSVIVSPTITVGPTNVSVINWTEDNMGANETRVITAKYMIKCTAASSQSLQIESQAAATPPLPDPSPLNNEDQNNPVINAGNPDLDGDGDLNAVDNCPLAANANQLNTDGDSLGNACDHDDDGDGIDDAVDGCPTVAEDPNDEETADGCPETDLSLTLPGFNANSHNIDVDVSENTNFTITATATNGNYGLYPPNGVTFLELLKSDITDPNDKCEARWIPQPGDLWTEDTVVEDYYVDTDGDSTPDTVQTGRTLLMSFLQVTLSPLPPFNSINKTREYTLHCNNRSDHQIFLEEGIVPTFPVRDPNVNNNVVKRNIHIEAWDVADVKIISADVHSSSVTGQATDGDGNSTVDCADTVPPLDTCATVTVTVKKVLHNNGPADVASATLTPSVVKPSDCTTVGGGPVNTPAGPYALPVSTQIAVMEVWTFKCNASSNHPFTFNNLLSINDVHVRDSDDTNNDSSTPFNAEVFGVTTVDIDAVTVNAPLTGQVSVDETFTVDKTITNRGPFNATPQVTQTLSVTGANAGDCNVSFHVTAPLLAAINGGGQGLTIKRDGVTVNPPTPAGWEPSDRVVSALGGNISISFQAAIASHTDLNLTEEWDKHCVAPSTHNFVLNTSVTDSGNVPHVSYAGDSASNPFSQDIYANADLKIASWTFLGPAEIDPNTWFRSVPLTCSNLNDCDFDSKEKLHNNGPYGPIDGKVTITATPAAGCDVLYEVSGNETSIVTTGNVEHVPVAAGTIIGTSFPMTVEIPVTLPVSVDVWLAERFGVIGQTHNNNECSVSLAKVLDQVDGHVIDANGASASRTLVICQDTDSDGIDDQCSVTDEQDNCTDVPNPGQQDSDGDGAGDACDARADHELVIKYCIKLGPAPVNLSSTQGSYMWILCEIGNFSDHAETVTIAASITGVPAGCTLLQQTILPGQSTIALNGQWIDNDGDTQFNEDPPDGLDNDGDSMIDEDGPDGDQKFILYRARFECHSSPPDIYPLTVDVSVDHVNHTDLLDDDGDTVADEDPMDGVDNDGDSRIDEDPPEGDAPPVHHIQTHQLLVDQP